MLCAISGEAPETPVASRKSGNIFEKRLIEAYIQENGKDPVNGEELSVDDLVELRSANVVRPRPPTLTSIPALLSVFQNEWDAIALQSYTLRQQLAQTRQELSTALYQHDAAVRAILRLTRERDEAREALSRVTVGAGVATNNGDDMHIDSAELPPEIATKVEETQARLSKTRRKRAVPDNWADGEAIESFKTTKTTKGLYPGCRALATDETADLVLLGGSDGAAGIYSISQGKVVQKLKGTSGPITDAAWNGSRAIVATGDGSVKIYDGGKVKQSFKAHAGAVAAVAVHPSGEILASVGVDKSYVLYDLESSTVISQTYSDSELTSAAFHPDGHLVAAGGRDGQIKIFDVKSGAKAASFDAGSALESLDFSENGIWLASAVKDGTAVTIWDLRKASELKVLEVGTPVQSLKWDYTGQFLATGGSGGVTVQQYSKASKEWSEPLKAAVAATAITWGEQANSLITVNDSGILAILGADV